MVLEKEGDLEYNKTTDDEERDAAAFSAGREEIA